jgi:hypothetical protein
MGQYNGLVPKFGTGLLTNQSGPVRSGLSLGQSNYMANWIYSGKSSNSRIGDKSCCMMAVRQNW